MASLSSFFNAKRCTSSTSSLTLSSGANASSYPKDTVTDYPKNLEKASKNKPLLSPSHPVITLRVWTGLV